MKAKSKKTYKQKQKRKKARENEKIKVYWDKFPHCRHLLSKNGYECAGYIIFDETNNRYFSGYNVRGKNNIKVECSSDLRLAKRMDAYSVNLFIQKYGYTGAWRPIRVREKK